MVRINGKHLNQEKLLAVLRRESLMLSVERNTAIREAGLRPTVFVPVKRGETVTFEDVAVHKV